MKQYLPPIAVVALLATSCTAGRDTHSTLPPPAAPASTKAVSSATTSVVQINDANYEETVRSHQVVLLLFWAEWSAPDRKMMPIIDALSKDYVDRVTIGKVNVDDNPELARKFGIKGIPTVVVIKDEREQERRVGLASRKMIADLLDKQL